MNRNFRIMNHEGQEQRDLPEEIVAVIVAAIEAQQGSSCCELPGRNAGEEVKKNSWSDAGIRESVTRRQMGWEMFM